MNKTTHFDPWHDRHTINMEPEQMDRFSDEDSLFAGQPNEKQYAIVDEYESHKASCYFTAKNKNITSWRIKSVI